MNDKPETKELQTAVFAKIESEKLSPRPRWYFMSRECLLWSLWLITGLLGAVAVSVSLSAVTYQSHALYEVTHDSYWLYVLGVLPYLWLVVFIVMGFAGIYNLRHTKRGYRYPLWMICLSSLIFSLAGGAFLHLVGIGFSLDKTLGERVPMYASQMKYERDRWQIPTEGRLIGKTVTEQTQGETTVLVWFRDIDDHTWQLDISELMQEDNELLNTGRMVAVMGHLVSLEDKSFHGCVVMPFVYEEEHTLAQLREIRSSMLRRLNSKRLPELPEGRVLIASSTCASLPILKRLKPSH